MNNDTPRTYDGYTLDQLRNIPHLGPVDDLIAHIEELQAEIERLRSAANVVHRGGTWNAAYDKEQAPEGVPLICHKCGIRQVMPYTTVAKDEIDIRAAEGWGIDGQRQTCPACIINGQKQAP